MTNNPQMLSEKPTADKLPWAPLYSVLRSNKPEITVYGIAFVWAENRSAQNNSGLALLRVGDTRSPLWSRSLLKPFQLMVLYPVLKQAYPTLNVEHWAMLMASHHHEARQMQLLQEIMDMGGLTIQDLQCPSIPTRNQEACKASPLYHPCCGKHLAHLLYLKAKGLPLNSYLDAKQEPYHLLRELFQYLLYVDELPETQDGCGIPNLGLSPVEMAQLYHALVTPVTRDMIRQCPDELTEILTCWDEIASIMQQAPELIGATQGLDSRLMKSQLPGQLTGNPPTPLIAKTGAAGLLCMGIGPTTRFSDGLGIFIKLSAGHANTPMETVIQKILCQLGLADEESPATNPVTQTDFYFDIQLTESKAGSPA
jgi:L-asparaginase II